MIQNRVVPIRPDHRWLYPIDWPELSVMVRFVRAGGLCEHCGCAHGARVIRLPDGRWYDEARACWRGVHGRRVRAPEPGQELRQLSFEGLTAVPVVRRTRIVLAGAHLDHDPGNNHRRNLAALCQRCHLLHDLPEHRRQRWRTLFRRRALGDLFLGPYPDVARVRGRLPQRRLTAPGGDRPTHARCRAEPRSRSA